MPCTVKVPQVPAGEPQQSILDAARAMNHPFQESILRSVSLSYLNPFVSRLCVQVAADGRPLPVLDGPQIAQTQRHANRARIGQKRDDKRPALANPRYCSACASRLLVACSWNTLLTCP
jgi:hypothetical protein